MDDEPEDIMLDEETVPARLQDEVLHEGLGDVLQARMSRSEKTSVQIKELD